MAWHGWQLIRGLRVRAKDRSVEFERTILRKRLRLKAKDRSVCFCNCSNRASEPGQLNWYGHSIDLYRWVISGHSFELQTVHVSQKYWLRFKTKKIQANTILQVCRNNVQQKVKDMLNRTFYLLFSVQLQFTFSCRIQKCRTYILLIATWYWIVPPIM
jgi:hypothetical protein